MIDGRAMLNAILFCPRGGLPVDHAAKDLALRRTAQDDVIVLDPGGALSSNQEDL